MNEPLNPELADEVASAILDGEATAEELATAETNPTIGASLDEFKSNASVVSSLANQTADEFTKSRHLKAAMEAFDELHAVTDITEVAAAPATKTSASESVTAITDARSSRSRGMPRWLNVAAGIFLAVGGLGIAFSIANGGGASDEVASVQDDSDASEDDSAAAGAPDSAEAFDSASLDETLDYADADDSGDSTPLGAADDATMLDEESTEESAAAEFDSAPSAPVTMEQTVLELDPAGDPSEASRQEVFDGRNALPLDASFCFTSGGFDDTTAELELAGTPYLYIPVSIEGEPLEMIVLDDGTDGYPSLLLTPDCQLYQP